MQRKSQAKTLSPQSKVFKKMAKKRWQTQRNKAGRAQTNPKSQEKAVTDKEHEAGDKGYKGNLASAGNRGRFKYTG